MSKLNMRSIKYIPESRNFSEYEKHVSEANSDDKEISWEVSDGGEQIETELSKLNGDQLLINLLTGLDNRDKIVLLYQILRESGYILEHEDCAKTLSLSRSGYVILVKNVKKKCMKILRSQKIV